MEFRSVVCLFEYCCCCHESRSSGSDDCDSLHKIDYTKTVKNTKNNYYDLQDTVFIYNLPMQEDSWDTIGTHILIQIDTDINCNTLFASIRERLNTFELRYSRFIE